MSEGALTGQHLIKKYAFWTITVLLIIISLWIIKPFIIAIISAFILAFLIKPVFDKLARNTGKTFASFISIIIVLGILIIPITLIITATLNQADALLAVNLDDLTNRITNSSFLNTGHIEKIKSSILSLVITAIEKTLVSIPSLIISILILIIAIHTILVNWDTIARNLKEYMPFKDKNRISGEISSLTKNIVYGYLFIALIEFIIGVIGFYLSGVKAFLILPMLIAILAFIPGLGPGVIWLPTSIYYFVIGSYATGIGVLITGLIISILIETIILAKVIGRNSKISSLVLLIGILGGVPIFGLFGFIIGPLVLIYTIK